MKPFGAHCDFCARPFTAHAWNQRTCVSCASRGAPDQSKSAFPDYLLLLKKWRIRENPRSKIQRRNKTTSTS